MGKDVGVSSESKPRRAGRNEVRHREPRRTFRLVLGVLLRDLVEPLALLRGAARHTSDKHRPPFSKHFGSAPERARGRGTRRTWIFANASSARDCFSHRMWRTFTDVAAFSVPLPP